SHAHRAESMTRACAAVGRMPLIRLASWKSRRQSSRAATCTYRPRNIGFSPPGLLSALYALDVRLTWPLIGRSEEMRTIGVAISDPGLVGILVSGPAGVGKSRIVREGLSSLASRGFEPRWAVGTMSARKLPLGAFAPWTESEGTDRLQLVRSVIDSVTS